jgi:hypothetical protein
MGAVVLESPVSLVDATALLLEHILSGTMSNIDKGHAGPVCVDNSSDLGTRHPCENMERCLVTILN